MVTNLPLILDIEASALENGFPIEIGIADPGQGAVHAWLVRPYAGWVWDPWDRASQRIHGLSRADLDRGDDVLTVAQGILRVVGGRKLATDNPEFDGFWLGRLFEGAREAAPEVSRMSLTRLLKDLVNGNSLDPKGHDAIIDARAAAIDHSAAGDAASWAAALSLAGTKPSAEQIAEVFDLWQARARTASPWRAGLQTIPEEGVQA